MNLDIDMHAHLPSTMKQGTNYVNQSYANEIGLRTRVEMVDIIKRKAFQQWHYLMPTWLPIEACDFELRKIPC